MIVGSRRKQGGALRTHDSAGEAALSRACVLVWKLSACGSPRLLSTPMPRGWVCLGFTTLCLRFGFWIFYRTTVIYLGQCARPRVLSPAGAAPRTRP